MSYDLIGDFVQPLLKAAGVPFDAESFHISVESESGEPPVCVVPAHTVQASSGLQQVADEWSNWNDRPERWLWIVVCSSGYETRITYNVRQRRVKKFKSKRT